METTYERFGVPGMSTAEVVRKAALVGAILVALPYLISPLAASQAVIFGIFALGYNLLLGYGGEMSFGHAAYYGLGAYGAMLSFNHLHPNLYVALGVGVVLATVGSVVLGAISLRRRGVYFSMITLALAQMVYYIFRSWESLTGGSTGLGALQIEGQIGPFDPTGSEMSFFIFCAATMVLTLIVLWRIVRSPFGRSLVAIRENERRASHLGYNSYRLLFLGFVFSGAISGLAGALNAAVALYITPNVLNWLVGGEVVMVTILGGIGTLLGPVIGAVIFIGMSNELPSILSQWQLIFGLTFVLVVLIAPSGVYGLYLDWRAEDREVFGDDQSVRDILDRLRP